MKTKLLLFLLLSLQGFAQNPQVYTTFQGATLNLFKYEGVNTMILANSNTLNATAMNNWLQATDGTYNFYYNATGKYPICYAKTCFNGKATIARVDATCGPSCGYLGFTGIELLNTDFDNTYTRILNDNQYDQAFFFEFGRNFWYYDKQLKYTSNDAIVNGYAVFMRFMAIESLGLNGAPYNGKIDFSTYRSQVQNLRNTYMANPNLNWENTLGSNLGVPNSGFVAADLFASFCFYLKENYGGMTWVENVWKKAALRPDAITTQDAVDNFIIASSQAANVNLTSLFQTWKWTPSVAAVEYLNSTLGTTDFSNDTNTFSIYPNPVIDKLNFESELKDINLYSEEGKFIKKYPSAVSINLNELPSGLYFIKASTNDNKKIIRKIIKG